MKLSNFRDYQKTGGLLNEREIANVTLTTGFWLWKKSRIETISRPTCGFWFFVSTGEFTPGLQAETLARAYEAQRGIK